MDTMPTIDSVKDLYVGYDLGTGDFTRVSVNLKPREFATQEDYIRFAETLRLIVGHGWTLSDPLAAFPQFLAKEVEGLARIGFIKKGDQGWKVCS